MEKLCTDCACAVFITGSKLSGTPDKTECRAGPPHMTITPIQGPRGEIIGQINMTAYPVIDAQHACQLFRSKDDDKKFN